MAFNRHNGAGRIPKIGIPCARDKSQRYYGLPIFIQNTTYLRAITDVGAAPIIIPLQLDEATLRVIYETVDGVFLPGGEDMDPAQYGEEHHEMLGATDPERDRTEMLLGRWALADSKPLMAICRGCQVLNVINGGSLYQDIRALRDGSEKHDYFPPQFERVRISHEVHFQPESRLARIYGPTTMVNAGGAVAPGGAGHASARLAQPPVVCRLCRAMSPVWLGAARVRTVRSRVRPDRVPGMAFSQVDLGYFLGITGRPIGNKC